MSGGASDILFPRPAASSEMVRITPLRVSLASGSMIIDNEYEHPIEMVSDSAHRPWRGFRVVEKVLMEPAECR